MNVTVVGAGNMGRGLGHVLVRGGHTVTVVDRDPEEAGRLAEELRGVARGGATAEAEAPGAGARGEVVILALYYPSTLEAARELGGELEGKLVVDIANPVNQTFDGLATESGTSAAEELARAVPAGARVVKAFNTTFAGTLVEGQVAGQPLDLFIAGDDEGAKEIVAQLARDGGLRAIDVGPLERARYLEGFGFLHMMVQQPLGAGFASAVKVIS
ncbi:MAG: reduced coenzyme oxidoreductase [Rubrobacteraceae bacterium]|jgi:NADPH-dependent F420 reductase|nr:reduced coenzyme oxidoreductase [Rubrobacteraceae bacterium]